MIREDERIEQIAMGVARDDELGFEMDMIDAGQTPVPLEDRDIVSIINTELTNSESYTNWSKPLDYYLGNPRGDEIDGRSQIISTDVADAIEWIMPQIMKAFTQNKEVVIFDPTSQEDELQAQLETEYVYDVLMKENNGFIELYTFVKDALLHRNGIMKVYPVREEHTNMEQFSGLTQDQLYLALADPSLEVASASQEDDGSFAITISHNGVRKRIVVECVAPECFRLTSNHNSIDVNDAKFTAHIFQKTLSSLAKEGTPPEVLERLRDMADATLDTVSDFRFQAQGETNTRTWTDDESMAEVTIAECYMYLDVDQDGIAEYVKVTCAGTEGTDVTDVTEVISIEPIDCPPWVTTTAIMMPHKFRGLSIYDRLKQIQDGKTALWRNMLDNIYLQNNQRHVVLEGRVNMDDVLTSRPGGVIRAKQLDAISPLINPSIGQDAFTMMTYMDSVRAGRVGVAPEGEVTPQRIGEKVGSEGVAALLNAKEELVGLMVRLIAETGIKPLCIKIRDLCTRHLDTIQDYKFRGTWVKVNPSVWPHRTRTTVRVGTGSGNKQKQIVALQGVLQAQQQIAATPGQTLVDQEGIYAALDDLAKFSELLGAGKYFLDPNSEKGKLKKQEVAQQMQQQQQQQIQSQMALLKAQMDIAQAEMQKAQAQQDNVSLRAQVERLKAQLEEAKQFAEAAGKDADRTLKKYDIDTKAALKLTELEVTSKAQQEANAIANREAIKDGEVEDETEETPDAAG